MTTELTLKARRFFVQQGKWDFAEHFDGWQCCDLMADFARSLEQWTPVEDGLPDEERDYLVTASNGDYFVAVATFENGTFLYGDVVAWRELPAAYQPQAKEAEQK